MLYNSLNHSNKTQKYNIINIMLQKQNAHCFEGERFDISKQYLTWNVGYDKMNLD